MSNPIKYSLIALLIIGVGVGVYSQLKIWTPPKKPGIKHTITVLGGGLSRDRKMWKEIEEGFERTYPDTDLIVLQGGANTQKLDTMIAGGVAPDVIPFRGDLFHHYLRAGAALDLMPFIEQDPQLKKDLFGYTDPNGQHHEGDFFSFAVETFQTTDKDGKVHVWALPAHHMTFYVYYNKDLFDKYNVPYPDADWDWNGFRDRALALTRDAEGRRLWLPKLDENGEIVTDSRGLHVYEPNPEADEKPYEFGAYYAMWQHGVETFIRQNGGRIMVKDKNGEEQLVCSKDPKTIEALEFLYNLKFKEKAVPNVHVSEGVGTWTLFLENRLGMLIYGVFMIQDARSQIKKFDWDVAPLPMGLTGIRASMVGSTGFGISSQCKHPRQAFKFVRWLTGKEGMAILAKYPVFVPDRRSIALSSEHFLDPNTKPDSDWALVHDLTCEWVDPRTGKERVGYAFRPAHTGVRAEDVYDVVNTYFYNLLLYDLKEYRDQAKKNHVTPTVVCLRKLDEQARRVIEWNRLRQEGRTAASWTLWGPIAVTLGLVLGLIVYRCITHRQKLGPLARKEQRWAFLFISPWIIGFVMLVAGPILFSIGLSFCKWQSLSSLSQAEFVGTFNYKMALTGKDPKFYTALKNTAMYTFISVPLHIIGGLCLALLMNAKIRGINIWRTVYFLPSIMPVVAVSVLYYYLFDADSGWVNHVLRFFGVDHPPNWLGGTEPVLGVPTEIWVFIIMSMWMMGGSMIIYLAGLQGIPTHLYEAAEIDGAGKLRQFWHVTLPQLSPVILFMTIMSIIGSFQVFTQAYVVFEGDTGPNDTGLFYVLHLFRQAIMKYRLGYGSALAWILFVIILIFTLLIFKSSPLWVHYEGAKQQAVAAKTRKRKMQVQ